MKSECQQAGGSNTFCCKIFTHVKQEITPNYSQKGNSIERQVQKGNCLFGQGSCLFGQDSCLSGSAVFCLFSFSGSYKSRFSSAGSRSSRLQLEVHPVVDLGEE
jgi:hypothetical protein